MLKQLRQQVESIVGVPSSELKKYANRYESELRRSQPESSSSEHFFKASKSSDVILVGDFHGQAQSARSLLRICRRLGSEIVLILECIKSKDQKYLDLYLKGHLIETDFLKVIKWKKSWDFPWEHTKLILDWAVLNQVSVRGMNLNQKSILLNKRDQHFAKIITQVQAQNLNLKVIVQVGDYHLAKKHLPFQIKKINQTLNQQIVFQSPDQIYLKIIKLNHNKLLQKTANFFALGNNNWALMTVVPWIKWQEYLLSLESNDQADDVTDHIDRFIHFMAEELGLNINTQDLSIYLYNDDIVLKKINKLEVNLRNRIKKQIQSKHSFYVPELKIGIISRLTVNHLSKVAAQFILYKRNIFCKTYQPNENNFLNLIWLEMLIYFLSKVTNPKRKTDTLADIKNSLSDLSTADQSKDALKLALRQKMTEIQYLNSHQVSKKIKFKKIKNSSSNHSSTYGAASAIIGGLLGEKIFYAFQKKIIKFPKNEKFLFGVNFNNSLDQKNFEKIYYKAIEIIDSWPLPFKSKYDQF